MAKKKSSVRKKGIFSRSIAREEALNAPPPPPKPEPEPENPAAEAEETPPISAEAADPPTEPDVEIEADVKAEIEADPTPEATSLEPENEAPLEREAPESETPPAVAESSTQADPAPAIDTMVSDSSPAPESPPVTMTLNEALDFQSQAAESEPLAPDIEADSPVSFGVGGSEVDKNEESDALNEELFDLEAATAEDDLATLADEAQLAADADDEAALEALANAAVNFGLSEDAGGLDPALSETLDQQADVALGAEAAFDPTLSGDLGAVPPTLPDDFAGSETADVDEMLDGSAFNENPPPDPFFDFEGVSTPTPAGAFGSRPVPPPSTRSPVQDPFSDYGADTRFADPDLGVGETGSPASHIDATPYAEPLGMALEARDGSDDAFNYGLVPDQTQSSAFALPQDFQELTPSERDKRLKLLGDERLRKKFDEIYEAIDIEYENILTSDVSVNATITNKLHLLLSEARFILINYDVDQLYVAEANIEEVRSILDRAQKSTISKDKWSYGLIGWALLWFFIFVYCIFNPYPLLNALNFRATADGLLIPDVFIRSMLFGGVGGVAAVFYSLLKYISARAYDPEYNFNYFVKPFMGVIVGLLVYLVVFVVMRFLNIVPVSLTNATPEQIGNVQIFTAITWFLALAAGFKENMAFDVLEKAMNRLFRRNKDETDSTGAGG